MDFINVPLGTVLKWIYDVVHSYGLTIVLFTLFTRLILLPLSIKQQKSSYEMQKIKPHLDELQKKHKGDKEKLSQETMKLYQEHGVNPAAGCLPLLVQLPIMFSLYYIISSPIKYILKLPDTEIQRQLKAIILDTEKLKSMVNFSNDQVTQFVKTVTENHNPQNFEIIVAKVNGLINFNFLGFLDLSATPHYNIPSLLWIIPILAAATTYLSSLFMATPSTGGDNDQAAQLNKNMMMMMPVMTLFFTFQVPAGLGIYWITSNVLQIVQSYVLNNYYLPKLKEGASSNNVTKSGKNRKDS